MTHPGLRTSLSIFTAAALLIGTASLRAQDATPSQDAPQRGRGNGEGRRNGRMIRGSVTGTSGNSVTLKTDAGEVWTVQATDNTRIIKNQQPLKIADIKAGDEVMAMGVPDEPAHQIHALMVGVVDAAVAAKARADMGKTYIVGRVTAVDETKLTIARPDHVSQIISVDETTSFHRGGRMNLEGLGFGPGIGGMAGGGGRGNNSAGGPTAEENGESITLADLKAGDNIVATGALKSGVFVPTDLRVQVRRPRSNGEGPGSAPGSGGLPAPPQQ